MHKTLYKTTYQKPFWVFPDFIFRIAIIQSKKRNSERFSAEEKKREN